MKGKLNSYESRVVQQDEKLYTCLHGFYYREICPVCGPRKEHIEWLKQHEREKFGPI